MHRRLESGKRGGQCTPGNPGDAAKRFVLHAPLISSNEDGVPLQDLNKIHVYALLPEAFTVPDCLALLHDRKILDACHKLDVMWRSGIYQIVFTYPVNRDHIVHFEPYDPGMQQLCVMKSVVRAKTGLAVGDAQLGGKMYCRTASVAAETLGSIAVVIVDPKICCRVLLYEDKAIRPNPKTAVAKFPDLLF